LRRAVELTPERAEFHYVLAKVTEELEGARAAIEGYARSAELAAEFAPAWTDLGIAQAECGDFNGAIDALTQARRLNGADVSIAFALGQSLLAAERIDEAIQVLEDAYSAGPGDADVAQALAAGLRRAERGGDAVDLLKQAITQDSQRADLHMELGHTLHEAGQTGDALAHFRHALEIDPELLAAHEALNRLLFELDDQQHYLASYRTAIDDRPHSAALRLAHAGWLIRAERYANAEHELREAMRLGSRGAQAHRLLARALANQGQSAEALAQFQAAVEAAPHETEGRRDLARMLLLLGDVTLALEQVNAALAIAPYDQEAIAFLGLCWRLLCDERETQLNDYSDLVRTYRIPVPAGYTDLDTFNQDLRVTLDELHTGESHPADQTLRGGTQTHGDLFARRRPAIARVRESIEQCVRAYIADMGDDSHHPLLSRKCDDFRFAASWSCRLQREGFHTNHVHPKGWISSCYYVSLPDVVKNGTDQQGWIKFGESSLRLGERERIARTVQPAEGLLVLFPSYMFHGTVPFDSQQMRTTIAFDVVPNEE
jgi:uncharacterized protein (TIGR02466 family)